MPTVRFPSMARWRGLLSEDNRAPLRLIRDKRLKSLTKSAELIGRWTPNLSRPPKMMAGYGLVGLKKNMREIEPIAPATNFKNLVD